MPDDRGRIEIYKDRAHEFRWRAFSGNGEQVGEHEGYTRRWSAKRAARKLFPGWRLVNVKD